MKIVCISDLHLSKSVYGVMDREFTNIPFRSADFMRSFKWMIDKCISEIKPDLVVIGGDVYDYYDVSNSIRGFFSNQLSRLAENKIPCIIIVGNHDICQRHHALNDIQELKLKSIKVIDQFDIIEFKGHRLCLFPYSLDIEQKKVTLEKSMSNFTEYLNDYRKDKDDRPTIFFGHFGIYGAILNDYEKNDGPAGAKNDNGAYDDLENIDEDDDGIEITKTTTTRLDYYNSRKDDVHVSVLDALGVDYILMGDFHKHQRLKTKTIGFYCGSIERTGFNEKNQPKGFIVYDSDAPMDEKYGKCQFIEYPNCRPMIDIRGNFESIKQQFSTYDCSKYQGAIVRLVCTGTSNDLINFSAGIEEFKKEISKKIDPIHMFTVPKPAKDKIQKQAATTLEKEIMERGHFTDKDVLDVLSEMVGERVKNKEEQAEVMKIANQIYNEVKEKQ